MHCNGIGIILNIIATIIINLTIIIVITITITTLKRGTYMVVGCYVYYKPCTSLLIFSTY